MDPFTLGGQTPEAPQQNGGFDWGKLLGSTLQGAAGGLGGMPMLPMLLHMSQQQDQQQKVQQAALMGLLQRLLAQRQQAPNPFAPPGAPADQLPFGMPQAPRAASPSPYTAEPGL